MHAKKLRPGAFAPGRSLSGIKNNMRFEKPIVNVYFRGGMICPYLSPRLYCLMLPSVSVCGMRIQSSLRLTCTVMPSTSCIFCANSPTV